MDETNLESSIREIRGDLRQLRDSVDRKPGWAGITGLMVGVLSLVLGGYTGLMIIIADSRLDAAALRAAQDLDERIDILEDNIEGLKAEVVAFSSNVEKLVELSIEDPNVVIHKRYDISESANIEGSIRFRNLISIFDPKTIGSDYEYSSGFFALRPAMLFRIQQEFSALCAEASNASFDHSSIMNISNARHNGYFEKIPKNPNISQFSPEQHIFELEDPTELASMYTRLDSMAKKFEISACIRAELLNLILRDRYIDRNGSEIVFDPAFRRIEFEDASKIERRNSTIILNEDLEFYMVPRAYFE